MTDNVQAVTSLLTSLGFQRDPENPSRWNHPRLPRRYVVVSATGHWAYRSEAGTRSWRSLASGRGPTHLYSVLPLALKREKTPAKGG